MPDEEPGALSNFFWGAVDVAGRGLQVAGGIGEVALGATIAGVGVVAEVPSAGTSTLAVLGGAAVGAHGIDQIYAGLFGTQSVASQLGSHLGNEIGGPWGGVIGGVLGDIGPNLKSMLTGVAAGAKSLGGFFKSMREAGGLKELIAEMRNAKQLSALLKSGKLTEQELAEMLKNGEVTLADLEAAGIKPPPPGVLVSDDVAAAGASSRLPQDVNVNPNAPRPLPLDRPIGGSPTQNARLQSDIAKAQAEGATDFRVNQQQVNSQGQRVGTNRPDLQYTDANGQRVYVEYDTSVSTRGPGHESRILSNDPTGIVKLETVD